MNVIVLTGRLTENPELKTTADNKSVCAFRVAVSRPHKKGVTDFFTCVAWRKTAEFVTQYFRKGQKIEIIGILTTREYEKDGNKKTFTEILCETVNFGESKLSTENTQDNISCMANGDETDFTEIPMPDDDLPF